MPSAEDEVREKLKDFVTKAIKKINELTADNMIEEGAINPLLVKALGINDFDSLARFYVYQRIGRSLVTSFGSYIEHIVKSVAHGEKGDWWDVVKKTTNAEYYMSVKSGPRDMDKDQVEYFSRKAKQIMKQNPKALPVIAMGYGKNLWPIIASTLRKQGLDPEKHALMGKKLYEKITGDPDYYSELLDLVTQAEAEVIGKKTVLEVIEDKVKEIADNFKKRYKNVDELLLDTF